MTSLPAPFSPDNEAPDWLEHATFVEAADFHLRRLARKQAELAKITADEDRMICRYRTWADNLRAPLEADVAVSEAALKALAAYEIEHNPNGPKSFTLPSGAIRSTAGRTSVQIDDASAFFLWAAEHPEHREDVIEVKHVPVKSGIKRVLELGEVVDGCRLEIGERSFSIDLEGDE